MTRASGKAVMAYTVRLITCDTCWDINALERGQLYLNLSHITNRKKEARNMTSGERKSVKQVVGNNPGALSHNFTTVHIFLTSSHAANFLREKITTVR
jgi:uncharacterized protein YPO0396